MLNKCNLGKRGLLDLVEGQYCNINHRSRDPGQLYALKTSDKRWKYNNNNVKKLNATKCYTFYLFFSWSNFITLMMIDRKCEEPQNKGPLFFF